VDEKHTILVIDDDAEIRRLLARTLSENHTVWEARDALDALDVLQRNGAPDLIICDVMMPGMNGFELIKHIRTSNPKARTPVIFLTAKDQPLDVVAGINAGARSYVTKPFKLAALVARVDRIVKQAS
jgi:DNA-binding response OmpR family regulator